MKTTTRRIVSASAALALGVQLLPFAAAIAADPVTETFVHTGTEQQFVVPPAITTVHVVLVGGKGGDFIGGGTEGGFGGRVEGDLDVTAGATLYIEVGGNGHEVTGGDPSPGGFNGGGDGGECEPAQFFGASGGGATDIRVNSRTLPGTLGSRLVVAGGGGGGGDFADGGSAGQPGAGISAGGAGTTAAGGAGGTDIQGLSGQAGSLGIGGRGASTPGGCGAGGGGGYFGGGGGAANPFDIQSGGSGGGGSSYAAALTNASVSVDATGTPSVTISYTAISDNGTVGAVVDVPTSAACLELSTTSISFGTQPFGAQDQPATPEVSLTNCSGLSIQLLGSGTNATGPDASWTLVQGNETCADTLGLDRYRLSVDQASFVTSLSTDPAILTTLAAGQASLQTALLTMPCPGSSGGGQTMSMSINYLAVTP
jgi:hypothetical protein